MYQHCRAALDLMRGVIWHLAINPDRLVENLAKVGDIFIAKGCY